MPKGSLVEIPLFCFCLAFVKWKAKAEQLLSNCPRMGLGAVLLLLIGVGAGGYCQEVGQSGLGEGLELGGGDVGEGLHQVGGQAFVDLGRDHLAVAFRNLEGAIDAAYEVAHHVVADAVEFGVGDGFLLQTVYFLEYLVHGVGGGLSGDVGGDV